MKLTKFGMAAAAVAAMAISASAADVNDLFPNNQLTLDVSGIYHKAFSTFGSQFDDNWRHGNFGGDVGLDYWFCKYVGIGVDSWGEATGRILHVIDGNLFLRMPVNNSGFAPYIYGGGGAYFAQDLPSSPVGNNWLFNCGAGVQYRFNRHIGLFTDWRYIFAEKGENSTLIRVGVQLGL